MADTGATENQENQEDDVKVVSSQGEEEKETEKYEETATEETGNVDSDDADDVALQEMLMKMQLGFATDDKTQSGARPLEEANLESLIQYIKSEKCKNVIIMSGAGISVAAGIPDFRSKGTGLYDNLGEYGELPDPTAIFEIGYFRVGSSQCLHPVPCVTVLTHRLSPRQENPKPFFALAKKLYPGKFDPTPAHYLSVLLQEKGLLLRNYTQNVDNLEVRVDRSRIVEFGCDDIMRTRVIALTPMTLPSWNAEDSRRA
eukprot:CAMPEP_0119122498 /NCGR_PEP_ID=MMETSP1310-20130426/2731_1 /TAXON_ID=464262 /ORGANISM="Genus nov. species nov., Strain RCC2339" /LENGTH=257 /DNA_ID=CAMNT_0007112157 /DNA_START=59 /DNA_END=832 /DNA_ORIENTATION=-